LSITGGCGSLGGTYVALQFQAVVVAKPLLIDIGTLTGTGTPASGGQVLLSLLIRRIDCAGLRQ